MEEAPKIEILLTKRRKRSAPLGMKIWRSAALNLDCMQIVEHIEIACPKYELTARGPELIEDENDC